MIGSMCSDLQLYLDLEMEYLVHVYIYLYLLEQGATVRSLPEYTHVSA